ncbi:MAG TPA: hypothetical protein VFL79_22415 [Terriglobia bacterium]|nr:hypothetical protein [Terriglobia bacterium]
MLFPHMPTEDGATRIEILIRRADQDVLRDAARARKQTLASFLAETLAVVAVDLRQPPRPAVTWLDVYSRHADLAPDAMDDDSEIYYTMSRPPRRARLAAGPPRNR